MNNFISVFLVIITLLTTGIWSPTPDHKTHHQNRNEDVIVKEGHRVIVVEYDKDGEQNTKVSISPPTQTQTQTQTQTHRFADKEEEDNVLTRSSSHSHRPNFEQAGRSIDGNKHDLICDSVGKCTDKLAHAIEKGKNQAKECAQHAVNVHKRMGSDVIAEKNEIAQAAGNMYKAAKESAKESWKTTKDTAVLAKDMSKTFRGDVVGNVSEEVIESVKRVKKVGRWFKWMTSFNTLSGVLHLLCFCTAYGSCMWVTFVSGYVLDGVLSRQQFGMVQTKIYRVYFRVMGYSVFMAIFGHILHKRSQMFLTAFEILQGFCLYGSLALVLVNALALEPRATKVMLERMKVEKEEGRGREGLIPESTQQQRTPESKREAEGWIEGEMTTEDIEIETRSRIVRLSQKLADLDSLSSLANVSTLVLLTVHLVYLGQRLNDECIP